MYTLYYRSTRIDCFCFTGCRATLDGVIHTETLETDFLGLGQDVVASGALRSTASSSKSTHTHTSVTLVRMYTFHEPIEVSDLSFLCSVKTGKKKKKRKNIAHSLPHF